MAALHRRDLLRLFVLAAGTTGAAPVRKTQAPRPKRAAAAVEVERLIETLQSGPALAPAKLAELFGVKPVATAGAEDHELATAVITRGPFARLELRRWMQPRDLGGGLTLYIREGVIVKRDDLRPRFHGSLELPLHANPDRVFMETSGSPERRLVLFFREDDRTLFKVQFMRSSAHD